MIRAIATVKHDDCWLTVSVEFDPPRGTWIEPKGGAVVEERIRRAFRSHLFDVATMTPDGIAAQLRIIEQAVSDELASMVREGLIELERAF